MAPIRGLLLRGLLAGAVAGLSTGLLALLLAEPTLEAAIALEPAGGDELFSRTVQKAGLVLGLVLVGTAIGALFGLAYRLIPSDVRARPWYRSLALALGGFVALYLVPFLRYPATPPGVGDESTLGDRTAAYLLCIALGVAVTTGAFAATRELARRRVPAWQRQGGVAVVAVVVVALAYALLPSAAPVGDTPADLVWDFRIRSLALQVVLYAVLGAAFGALAERAATSAPTRVPAGRA